MEIKQIERNGHIIAVIRSDANVVADTQSALDLLASVHYETGSSRIVLNKEAVADEFFVLSSCLAGEILQKFVTYHTKLAIYGDYSRYKSKPLGDFIYESNCGNDIYFAATEEEAIAKLAAAQ